VPKTVVIDEVPTKPLHGCCWLHIVLCIHTGWWWYWSGCVQERRLSRRQYLHVTRRSLLETESQWHALKVRLHLPMSC